jgi:molecular chaperone DnaK
MHLALDIDSHAVRAALLDAQGIPRVIPLGADGTAAMPAVVRATMHGLSAGWEAAQSRVGNRETSVMGCTRLLGRADSIVPALETRLPYTIRNVGGEVVCNLLYHEARASHCYGELIRAAVTHAEQTTGAPIEDVVLTVPASADDRLRIQVRKAAEDSGVTVRRLLNQPTAALLAAVLPPNTQRVLVVHAGQGTTDATVATIENHEGQRQVRVLATTGDPLLGGDDWFWTITEQVAAQIQARTGIDLAQVDGSGIALAGLRDAIENAFPTLAFDDAAMLVLEHGGGFGRDIVHMLARNDVERWLQPMIDKVTTLCRRALKAANPKQEVVVLVTGAMAGWRQLQAALAPLSQTPVLVAPPELTVLGAAYATQERAAIWDVTPYPVGINCYYGSDELLSTIIAANTPIPTPQWGERGAFKESYVTRYPDQTSVNLSILQYRGERIAATSGANKVYSTECETLGSWLFDNLKPPRGGHADFTVTFAIDRDGILHLNAVETATGHTLSATVERGIG